MPRAVNDDVIVKLIHEKESAHGIIIPDQAKANDAEFHGLVVSVGPENKEGLKKGQKVLFMRHEGIQISEDGETYHRLRREWILAILK